MATTAKKYSTSYKKKTDTDQDSYLPRRSPKETLRCVGCGAFYYRRHWTLTAPDEFNSPDSACSCYCPACRKIKDRCASGELDLVSFNGIERRDILRILRNEEARAREKNPLERIMRIDELNGGWRVQTTTEKLAQRLGRAVRKARGGKLQYKWSHNNKFLRVIWEK
jgi:hypothetical protein